MRPATRSDAAAIARVQVETSRSAYRALLPAALLEAMTVAEREVVWDRGIHELDGWVLVAESAGGVVGFVHAGKTEDPHPGYTSEIFSLYVSSDWQRRGIGSRLFSAAARRLRDEGHRAMLLETLSHNPARAFYDRLGGAALGTNVTVRDGYQIAKVCYGWPDLAALG